MSDITFIPWKCKRALKLRSFLSQFMNVSYNSWGNLLSNMQKLPVKHYSEIISKDQIIIEGYC